MCTWNRKLHVYSVETNSILQLNTFLCYYAPHIGTNTHFVLKMSLHKWHFFFTCSVVTGKKQSEKLSTQNVLYSKAIRYICSYFCQTVLRDFCFYPGSMNLTEIHCLVQRKFRFHAWKNFIKYL